ncbi:Hypothetical predicted protein [Podarcis lilfordi]|uniref:Uncharacterized protein n=1 Tax=Podarcis lilfordi TaxID=74358 RepID=A0AA35PM03_9SAUR|nr:Hypothetical predicted protein [Podarcis lilfordi]
MLKGRGPGGEEFNSPQTISWRNSLRPIPSLLHRALHHNKRSARCWFLKNELKQDPGLKCQPE